MGQPACYALDGIFLRGYGEMACDIEATDEFQAWFAGLNPEEQADVVAYVDVPRA